ncbi:MAG: GNAT family N-acetyltransferase [Terracidiphilus sp.]|nr:GNAT family N-acetyltransferase [Terracidiphilus sp.]
MSRYSELVQKQGDSERDVLGFLPRAAYSEAAAQGKLYVATIEVAGEEHYAGHLMYGGKFPHLRIFQLYTLPQFRGQHIGRELINSLAADAESQYYITISARVASDLPANEFWERVGFKTVRTVQGGLTTGRQINLRKRELDSPTLFSVPGGTRAAVRRTHSAVEPPIFALDVNVFLDVIKDRPRGEYAKRLLTASLSGMLRLFVAREFVDELSRAARQEGLDPVVQMAMTLPQFTGVPDPFLTNLKRELATLIFPVRVSAGQLRGRDESDLIHLATMIYHSASGFVTSDDSILSKRNELRARFGIEVLGPAELAEIYIPRQWTPARASAESLDGNPIKVSELDETRKAEVELFLKSCNMTDEQVSQAIAPGQSACPRHRVVVSLSDEVVGFAAWDATRGLHFSTEAWLGADPTSPAGELACDVLLDTMFRDACALRPARVIIDSGQMSREALESVMAQGFRNSPLSDRPTILEKFCIGKIVSPPSWREVRASLSESLEFALPVTPPTYSGPETEVTIDRKGAPATNVALQDFESCFGPVLLMLPGRPIVVVPIQRSYADRLLDTAHQHSLFPHPEASVLGEKLYLSSPRTLSVLVPGAIILFYESIGMDNGRGAIVAAAQITRTAVSEAAELDPGTTRRGVLSQDEIKNVSTNNRTGLTFFNHLFRFETPVGLSRLRELGCADGANFVTARQIDEGVAAIIIKEGRPNVRLS